MKLHIHFNKRAKDDKVWSIITSKACYHAKTIIFKTIVITEYKPNKKRNPRAFMMAEGNILLNRQGIAIIY